MIAQPGSRAEARRRKAAQRAEFQAMLAAGADERARFNTAVAALPWEQKPILATFCGPYRVTSVSRDWWYSSWPADAARRDEYNARSWASCNDGAWSDLLTQVGVARHPRFARAAA